MPKWTEAMDDEDLNFLKRFVVASGSLKDLAATYGVSYPTIRLRLDRLIEKIRAVDALATASEFELALRLRLADGKLDPETFKILLETHRRELNRAAHTGGPQ